jgi:diguanylate cyclase
MHPSEPNMPPSQNTLSSNSKWRVRAVFNIGALATAYLGATWGTYYFIIGKTYLTAIHFTLPFVVAAQVFIFKSRDLHLEGKFISITLPLFAGVLCLFDTPFEGTPRSVHIYFIPLAIGIFFISQDRGVIQRHLLPMLCIAAFIVFGSMSIGITDPSLLPPPEVRPVSLWANTITAMACLVGMFAVMQIDLTSRKALEKDLHRALAQGAFFLQYQPQVEQSGHVVGVEALLRWTHPTRGAISPADFIPLAEETGLIFPISDWVLREACAQQVRWAEDPLTRHLTVSINISGAQFRRADFVQTIETTIRASAADPRKIKLELTESIFVHDADQAAAKMIELHNLGFGWALDDFGTGFSSLSVLKKLPLDQLKIDKSFVRDISHSPKGQAIVKAIISLSNELGITTIAEGTETREQIDWLKANGCSVYQGFYFSPSLNAQNIRQFVAEERSLAA